MKSSIRLFKIPSRLRPVFFKLLLPLLLARCGTVTLQAQGVLAVDEVPPERPANAATPAVPSATQAENSGPSIQWGEISLRPRLNYRLLHGDGILASPGQPLVTTTMQSFNVGLALNLGTHWTLDYAPTRTIYSSSQFKDTTAQLASITGRYGSERLLLQIFQNYEKSSEPIIQTGRQTDQTAYATTLSASYRLGEHMSLDSSVNHQALMVDSPSPSTRNWYLSEGLRYTFTDRTSASLNLDVGYVSIDPGADMTFTRPQAGLIWQATSKLSFNALAGFENRKFRSGPAEDLNSPSYRGIVVYQPFQNTKLSLFLVRAFGASYLLGQMPESTRWNIVLDQRLFEHFRLHTGYAEETIEYVDTTVISGQARQDKSYLYNARLSTTLFKKVIVTAVYQHRTLNSSAGGYSFSGSYSGLEIGYRY